MVDFDALRPLALELPEVEEGPWYGSPAFRVRGRVFARLHENDDDLFLMKVGADEREGLIAEHPNRFHRTEHRSEREDSVLMTISATSSEDLVEVAELLELAWRRVAPKSVLHLLAD